MKTFKDIYLNNELHINEDCYYDHKVYTYKGVNDEGKYILELHKSDEIVTKLLDKEPAVPQLPLGTYLSRKLYGTIQLGEITGYTHMLDKMYYKVTIYSDVFKGYENEAYESLIKKWELLEDNPFIEADEFIDELDDIDSEINTLESNIKSIKMEIEELRKKRNSITQYCKHKWYKYDEEEISKNYYEQECECEICGEKKTNRYNRF